jgi:hypothetical protein
MTPPTRTPKKKRNPQDTTLRNTRAATNRLARLTNTVDSIRVDLVRVRADGEAQTRLLSAFDKRLANVESQLRDALNTLARLAESVTADD